MATSNLFTVEIAPGDAPFETSPTWTDITSRVREGTIQGGRATPYGPFPGRTLNLILGNDDRAVDGFHDSDIAANMPVRVTFTANSVDYVRFYGFVDGDTIGYRYPEDSVASFRATDLTKFVARETNLGLGTVPAERSDDRFERILDTIGVPAGWRDIDTAARVMIARELNTDAATALNACVTTEGPMAGWFVTRTGTVRFDGRHCYGTRTRMLNDQALLTTDGIAAALGGVLVSNPAVTAASETMQYTAATVTNALGVASSATTGSAPYLRYPDTTTDTETSGQYDADLIVSLFGAATRRVERVTVDWPYDGTRLAALAQLDMRDRVRVYLTLPQSVGTAIDIDCTIEGISERFAPGELYRATYTLFPTTAFDALEPAKWARVGTAQVGSTSNAVIAP